MQFFGHVQLVVLVLTAAAAGTMHLVHAHFCCKYVISYSEEGVRSAHCQKAFSPWPCTPQTQYPPPDAANTPDGVTRLVDELLHEQSDQPVSDEVMIPVPTKGACQPGQFHDYRGRCRDIFVF